MKKVICVLSFLLLVAQYPIVAANYTISGYINDVKNSESLLGASVFDLLSKKGTVSNNFGFFSLTLPEGAVDLRVSYIGYSEQQIIFSLTKDTVINIQLFTSNELKEVVVTANQSELGVRGSQMGAIEIPVEQLKAVPTLLGEADILKALQLLPGVQGGTEGSAGMYVRGGGPDENLILLDGIPVYNINHMFGFFSVFNADAIKNVTLYKGSFPARFGGRLSSVIDIRMNDGDLKNYHGNVNLGLIASKFNIEGPIIKDKTSFNFSARRTYFDLLTQPLIKKLSEDANTTAGYYFYDLNAKLTHKFSDKDRLYVSAYLGDDAIYADVTQEDYEDYSQSYSNRILMDWDWGNAIAAARWNHVLNNKLFMNTTAAYTRYRFYLSMSNVVESTPPSETDGTMKIGYRSAIEDYVVKVDFDYIPNPDHDIKLGLNYTYHTFRPGVNTLQVNQNNENSINSTTGDNPIYAHETSAYIEDNFILGAYIKANIGLHYSFFHVEKKHYQSLQPRLSARFLATENLSFKAGYAYMSQHIHLLSNSSLSLPTDLWVPVTKHIVPMNSHQVSAGVFYNLKNWMDFSVEGYYKTMNNILEYKDGANFFGSAADWEDKVSMGQGWSYGVELLAQRSFGKTTGWLGYTWSKSERLFDRPDEELNFGKVFPAKFDRRHDISFVVQHKFNDRIDIAGTWVYSTGNSGTLALQNYTEATIPDTDFGYGGTIPHVSARNNYRMPAYHRFDIGINFHKKKRLGIRTWNISIYNVYNRLNPFFVYTSSDYDYLMSDYGNDQGFGSYSPGTEKKSLKQVSLFPIIPSISYTFKF